MAWKFRQDRVADGDVVEPSEFRINTNEFVSELNGFLDADNVKRKSIGKDEIKRNTFTELIGPHQPDHLNGTYIYIFNHHDGFGWQDQAYGTPNPDLDGVMNMSLEKTDSQIDAILSAGKMNLPRVRFSSDHDGLAIIEFCGFVSWSRWHFNINFPNQAGRDDTDVLVVAMKHPSIYQAYMKQTKNFKTKGMYILCSQWRLTLNGMSVAESGPLGNEYQSHPIYLCGTAPVIKGKENVAKVEGRFFWYSPGDDNSIEASAWSPLVEDFTTDTYRRDCILSSVNMLVTYRKR